MQSKKTIERKHLDDLHQIYKHKKNPIDFHWKRIDVKGHKQQ